MSINRTYKNGIGRLSTAVKYSHSSNREKEDVFYKRMKQLQDIAKKRDEELQFFDVRYATIVNTFMHKVHEKEVDIYAPDFEGKLDAFLQKLVIGKFYTARFKNDDIREVKNAILRRVNEEKRKNESSREK